MAQPLIVPPPKPSVPRVGDRVRWHEKDILHSGTYLGHRYVRQKNDRLDRCTPIVRSELLGQEVSVYSFDVIRLENPDNGIGPNWDRLPSSGIMGTPPTDQSEQLRRLLNRVMPPGPTYAEFLSEIWHRGYEAYVVGGTVRDVIAGRTPKDVDVATTMPLPGLVSIAVSMYGAKPSTHLLNGYLRIGGSNRSGDPILDVRVFSKSGAGTPHALFGTEFDGDVAQRDFACNSIYYEPSNGLLIDPSGRGIPDAASSVLDLVCNVALKSKPERAEIAIRCFKFLLRGFTCTDACIDRIRSEFLPGFPALTRVAMVEYFRRQVLFKAAPQAWPSMLKQFQEVMEQCGCGDAYQDFIHPMQEDLLK